MRKNLYKILAIIFALMISVPTVSFAGGEIEILFPEDGAVIENADCEVFISEGEWDEVLFELDGKIAGKDSFTLKGSELTLGKHILTAYGVSSDGSISEATSTFTVCKKKSEAVISANLNNPSTATLTASTVELGDNVNIIPQKNQTGYATVSIIDRAEGDKAVNLTSENSFSKPRPFANIVFPKTVESKVEVKHDIKLNSTNTAVWYELYTGDKAYYFNGTKLFEKGKVMGKTYEYDADTWYTVTLIFDFAKRLYSVYIGEDVIIENQEIEAKGVNMASCRIVYECGKTGGGYSLDNVYVNEIPEYCGISDMKFVYGEELSEDKNPDTQKLSAIRTYFSEGVKDGDVSESVQLLDEDGKEVKISSATGTASEKYITIVPEEKLSENKKYTLLCDININDAEDKSGAKSGFSFKTKAGLFDVENISLLCGEGRAVSVKQLKNAPLSAKINFALESEKKISVILSMREDDKLLAVSAKDIVIDTENNVAEIQLPQANVNEKADVQLIFVESIQGRKPVFKIYEYTLN